MAFGAYCGNYTVQRLFIFPLLFLIICCRCYCRPHEFHHYIVDQQRQCVYEQSIQFQMRICVLWWCDLFLRLRAVQWHINVCLWWYCTYNIVFLLQHNIVEKNIIRCIDMHRPGHKNHVSFRVWAIRMHNIITSFYTDTCVSVGKECNDKHCVEASDRGRFFTHRYDFSILLESNVNIFECSNILLLYYSYLWRTITTQAIRFHSRCSRSIDCS